MKVLFAIALWALTALTVFANKDVDAMLSAHIEGLLDIPDYKAAGFDVAHYGNATMTHIETLDRMMNQHQNERGIGDFFKKIKNAIKKAIAKRKAKKAAYQINKMTEETPINEQVPTEELPAREAKIIEKTLASAQALNMDAKSVKMMKKIQPALLTAFNKAMASDVARKQLKAVVGDEEPVDASKRIQQVRKMVKSSVSEEDQKALMQAIQTAENPHHALLKRGLGSAIAGGVIALFLVIAIISVGALGFFIPLIVLGAIGFFYFIFFLSLAIAARRRHLM